jgi:hypothetical protein
MKEISYVKYEFKEIGIKATDVEQMLGYGEMPANEIFSGYIEEILEKAAAISSIEGGIVIFDSIKINKVDNTLRVFDNDREVIFDAGKIIVNQLKNSELLAFFVCTAGNQIENFSRQLFKDGDFPHGYITDIVGSLTADMSMDKVQEKLKQDMEEKGLLITNRYSPGYCGWHVSEQQKLFSLLPENFCNISLSEHSLMSPIKSVSGIIGIGKKVKYNPYTCQLCDMKDCIYRNRQLAK